MPADKTNVTRYRVLTVENNVTDAILLEEWLKAADGEYDITHVDRLAEAIALLHQESFDVVLLDLGLPDSNGLETFVRLREEAPHLAVVVLTGLADIQTGLDALKKGAQDYLVKQEMKPAPLSRAVRYAVERAEFENTLQEKNKELEKANRSLQQEVVKRQTAQLETARIHEDRVNMKGEFLSHVSHELRSPLSVVHQFTTILLDGIDGPITKDQREHLEIMLRNVNHLKLMIDDLLDASRADTSKLAVRRSSVSIEEIIEQCVQSHAAVARERNVSLRIEIPADLPAVYADQSRISQVVTNLIDNAIKFSRSDTTVTIRAAVCENDGTLVRVSVADQGSGIAPEDVERVFDRLYQAKNSERNGRQGLGLGLYICRELIALHGGRIWVDSKRMSGATFHFTLPIFTIETTVLPVVMHEGRLVHSVALVRLELTQVGRRQSERDRLKTLNHTAHLLERCIRPDTDALLPTQHQDDSDCLSILARTDAHGAEVLLSRVKEQLSRKADFTAAGLSSRLESEVVDLGDLAGQAALDDVLPAALTRVKERLNGKQEKGSVVR